MSPAFEIRQTPTGEAVVKASNPKVLLNYNTTFRFDDEVFSQIVNFVRKNREDSDPAWTDILRELFPGEAGDRAISQALGRALLGEFDGEHHDDD